MPLDIAAMDAEQTAMMDAMVAADSPQEPTATPDPAPAADAAQAQDGQATPGEHEQAATAPQDAQGDAQAPGEGEGQGEQVDPRDAQIKALMAVLEAQAGGQPATPAQEQAAQVAPVAPASAPPSAPTPGATPVLSEYKAQDFMSQEEADSLALDPALMNTVINRAVQFALTQASAMTPQVAATVERQVRAQIEADNFMRDFFEQNQDLASMPKYAGQQLVAMSEEARATNKVYPDKLSVMKALGERMRTSLGMAPTPAQAGIKTVDQAGKEVAVRPALAGGGAGRRGGAPPAMATDEASRQKQLMDEMFRLDA